jgi:spermidine synthase
MIAESVAPDGVPLKLERRGDEFLIRAAGRDLMSNRDDGSSRALARFGCAHIAGSGEARVLVGGLGMGFTVAEALRCVGAGATVEVAELVPAVVEWNREFFGELAGNPLEDPRTRLFVGDVSAAISRQSGYWDAILLDVDNGPCALAHGGNQSLYQTAGLRRAYRGLRSGGVLGVWSFGDDRAFTKRLQRTGFEVSVERVEGSRRGRGRRHVIWVATKTVGDDEAPRPDG